MGVICPSCKRISANKQGDIEARRNCEVQRMPQVKLTEKDIVLIESFTGSAKGRTFKGVRFRVGKAKPKTIIHFHASRALAIIDALNAVIADLEQSEGDSVGFYESMRWQRLRYSTLKKYRKCCLCGSADRLHVDHIKPRSKFPELAHDPDNLQVLCAACNLAKSNRDSSDYR